MGAALKYNFLNKIQHHLLAFETNTIFIYLLKMKMLIQYQMCIDECFHAKVDIRSEFSKHNLALWNFCNTPIIYAWTINKLKILNFIKTAKNYEALKVWIRINDIQRFHHFFYHIQWYFDSIKKLWFLSCSLLQQTLHSLIWTVSQDGKPCGIRLWRSNTELNLLDRLTII